MPSPADRKPQCTLAQTADSLDGPSEIYEIKTHASGAAGSLPLTAEMLRDSPSGDIFGLSQNAGMGWNPSEVGRRQFLILSTQGGLRAPDGRPIALGYHTGHWEIGLLVQAAAEELRRAQDTSSSRRQRRRPRGRTASRRWRA